MSDSRVLAVLRSQAWERAKGELESMLHTYYDNIEKFERMESLLREFFDEVEDNGIHE